MTWVRGSAAAHQASNQGSDGARSLRSGSHRPAPAGWAWAGRRRGGGRWNETMREGRTYRAVEPPPGTAVLPRDFAERLTAVKERSGLSWESLAAVVGVDSRQMLRWRRGSAPSGGAMLSLVRWAARQPGGLALLLDEPLEDPRPKRRADW